MKRSLKQQYFVFGLVLVAAATAGCAHHGNSGSTTANTFAKTMGTRKAFNAFLDAVNKHDYTQLAAAVTPDFVRHSNDTPQPVRGPKAYVAFQKEANAAFPDQKNIVEMMVVEGDKVAVRARFEGTHKGQLGPFPPTNKKVDLPYALFARIADGKVAEIWLLADNEAWFKQLQMGAPSEAPPAAPKE